METIGTNIVERGGQGVQVLEHVADRIDSDRAGGLTCPVILFRTIQAREP